MLIRLPINIKISNFAAQMKIAHKKYLLNLSVIAMAIAFAVLMVLQLTFFLKSSKLAEKQFSDSAKRAISQTSYAVEEEEVAIIINEISKGSTPEAIRAKELLESNDIYSIQEIFLEDGIFTKEHTPVATHKETGIAAASNASIEHRYKCANANRTLLYALMARRYARMSGERITKRVHPKFIHNTLQSNLKNNEIDLDFLYAIVCNETGAVFYFDKKKFDINDKKCFSARFFSHDITNYTYNLVVYFPDKTSFFHQHFSYMLPYLIASFILLSLCIITLTFLFRERQIGQIRSDFIQNMTHELKTPVASISLAAQMLNDKTIQHSEEMTSRMCNTLLSESKRLVLLIDRVLQTSVLEQKGKIVNPSPLDVHDIITNAKNNLLLKIENIKQGEVRLYLNAEDYIISGDETHFTNIIYNLIDNAAKYASPERLLLIEIKTYNRNNSLFIEISDNGIGIDHSHQKHIFEKYYRVPTGEVHNFKGFGLGLAYVKNMVERHNGEIHVESELGIGTRFTIKLPLIT